MPPPPAHLPLSCTYSQLLGWCDGLALPLCDVMAAAELSCVADGSLPALVRLGPLVQGMAPPAAPPMDRIPVPYLAAQPRPGKMQVPMGSAQHRHTRAAIAACIEMIDKTGTSDCFF